MHVIRGVRELVVMEANATAVRALQQRNAAGGRCGMRCAVVDVGCGPSVLSAPGVAAPEPEPALSHSQGPAAGPDSSVGASSAACAGAESGGAPAAAPADGHLQGGGDLGTKGSGKSMAGRFDLVVDRVSQG
jgi:hypothetical protein